MSNYITKYSPASLNRHTFNTGATSIIQTLIDSDDVNVVFIGSAESGKTTMLSNTIREYYGPDQPYSSNVLHVHSLNDQGTNFCRNDLRNFCQVKSTIKGKKKLVRIENIDLISETNQNIYRSLLDAYRGNVCIVCTCTHLTKVVDPIQSRLHLVSLDRPSNADIGGAIDAIVDGEGLVMHETARLCLVELSRRSISRMATLLEKIVLSQKVLTAANVRTFCESISSIELGRYIRLCEIDEFQTAVECILAIHAGGYSLIDIYDEMYHFSKTYTFRCAEHKYKVIILISEYTCHFYEYHEHPIELVLFTANIRAILQASAPKKMKPEDATTATSPKYLISGNINTSN